MNLSAYYQSIKHLLKKDVLLDENKSIVISQTAQQMLMRLDLVRIHPQIILDASFQSNHTTNLLAKRYPQATICDPIEADKIADHSVDLIFSNLLLPFWHDLPQLLSEWHRLLKPAGLLFFSSLGPDAFKELRESWAAIDKNKHVLDFLDMHDIGDLLVQQQFNDPVMDVEFLTLTYQHTKAMLHDLRAHGVRNINPSRMQSLCGKERFSAFLQRYQQYQLIGGALPLSCEILYGHAWGGDLAVPAVNDPDAVTNIPLRNLFRRRYSS